jgi:hypothetical protein
MGYFWTMFHVSLRLCLPILLITLSTGVVSGADTTRLQIDIRRQKLHEDIDAVQARLLAADGRSDRELALTADREVNLLLTDVYTRRLDALQDSLEVGTLLDHRLKVKYLTGLEHLLSAYLAEMAGGRVPPEQGSLLFAAFESLVRADSAGRSIAPLAEAQPFPVGNILFLQPNSVFYDTPGFTEARNAVFLKFCTLNPEKVLDRVVEFSDQPFADSLIALSARRYPNTFYDHAAATGTSLGQLIRRQSDPLARVITEVSSRSGGRLLFPFIDEVVHGRLTLDQIEDAMKDSIRYFRLMVSTQTGYLDRMRGGDTPMAALELPRMMKRKADEVFINTINALHDEPDPVRFRILEPLTPRELYYLIVLGEDIIYTSSYRGVYNRMMERMRTPAGDTLLLSVRFDRFKKFVKMAAGFNRLDHFLSTMPDSNAQRLMIAFARGLDRTGGLEEAVDVADSYGSITTPTVRRLIDREIESSRVRSRRSADRRSFVIYDILQTIFRSSDDSTVDLSARLGIPPVYRVEHRQLTDTGGRVVQLVFFYGDEDGMESFTNFMSLFTSKADWSVVRTKEWAEIRSLKGDKVVIYANLPLDNSGGDDPDAQAQAHLLEHLEARGLAPTVVIHRGHSYHLKYTLAQLPASARVVILGSCGGYHNLDEVLERCPDAHIVSSKEVGTRTVNEPILRMLNDDLRNGRDIQWVPMWRALSAQFTNAVARERFENYIPPHRNLGALFIKAYRQAMGPATP